MGELTIRNIQADEVEIVRRFYAERVKASHIFCRNAEYFLWKFRRGPYVPEFSEGLSFLAAFSDGELAGVLGFLPLRLNLFGRMGWCCHLVDWFSVPDARRGSVGLHLLMKVTRDDRFQAWFAADTTNASQSIYRRLGWSVSELLPRRLAIINKIKVEDYVREYQRISTRVGGWPVARPLNGQAAGLVVGETPSVAEPEWDGFYWGGPAVEAWGVARNSDFLRWRYQCVPGMCYRFVLAKSSEGPRGLLVFRDETSSDGGLRIARIMEWVGTEEGLASCLDCLLHLVQGEGFDLVDCFAIGGIDWELTERRGFVSVTGKGGYSFPHLFQPFNPRLNTLTCAWMCTDLPDQQVESSTEKLYFTRGDGDLDRPP